MRYRLPSLLLASALLALGGCASAQSKPGEESSVQAQKASGQQSMCAMCPMGVQGTQVAVEDVEGGVALTFTTTTGSVDELRARVAKMAEHHNAMASGQMGACCKQGANAPAGQAACPKGAGDCPKGDCLNMDQACMGQGGMRGGGMGGGGMGGGMGMGMGGMPMMSAKASSEDVPGGARLVLKTEDPAQVAALREHAHRHAEMMTKGECGCAGKQAAQKPGAQGT